MIQKKNNAELEVLFIPQTVEIFTNLDTVHVFSNIEKPDIFTDHYSIILHKIFQEI
jgi:hypothetical protein